MRDQGAARAGGLPNGMSQDHHVHGMGYEPMRADWPVPGPGELEALRTHVAGLSGPVRILWRSPRPFSSAVRASWGGREFFVKRHHRRVRDAASVLEEHAFIEHLGRGGVPVPQLLRADDGRTVVLVGDWTYEIHAPAAGIDLYRDAPSWTPAATPGHARAAGAALARLHLAALGHVAPARRTRPLLAGLELLAAPDLPAALRAFVTRRPALADYFDQTGGVAMHLERIATAMDSGRARIQALLAQLAALWVHNDWHVSNLFWSAAGEQADVVSVIDFGLCNLGCAVQDLATALERNTLRWLDLDVADPGGSDIGEPRLATALIEGYASVRPLSGNEREALLPLLSLGHVELALSEVDYFHGTVGNDAHARLAYPDFLLGHLRWFDGEPGRRYLDAVRRCVETLPVAGRREQEDAQQKGGA